MDVLPFKYHYFISRMFSIIVFLYSCSPRSTLSISVSFIPSRPGIDEKGRLESLVSPRLHGGLVWSWRYLVYGLKAALQAYFFPYSAAWWPLWISFCISARIYQQQNVELLYPIPYTVAWATRSVLIWVPAPAVIWLLDPGVSPRWFSPRRPPLAFWRIPEFGGIYQMVKDAEKLRGLQASNLKSPLQYSYVIKDLNI